MEARQGQSTRIQNKSETRRKREATIMSLDVRRKQGPLVWPAVMSEIISPRSPVQEAAPDDRPLAPPTCREPRPSSSQDTYRLPGPKDGARDVVDTWPAAGGQCVANSDQCRRLAGRAGPDPGHGAVDALGRTERRREYSASRAQVSVVVLELPGICRSRSSQWSADKCRLQTALHL